MSIDWNDGDYPRTAAALEPTAAVVLEHAGVAAGQRVLDVACGTGKRSARAARRGAHVVGVDAAPMLIDLARHRAHAAGVELELLVGDALALPVPDAAFDAVLSLFGVIFASDPPAAAAELVRVTRPGGVIVVTTWTDEGAIAAAGRLLRQALGVPASATPPPTWDALLAAAGAAEVTTTRATLPFTAASPQAWLAEQEEHQPVWRAGRRQLSDRAWTALSAQVLRELVDANENPDAFTTTGSYLVVRARR